MDQYRQNQIARLKVCQGQIEEAIGSAKVASGSPVPPEGSFWDTFIKHCERALLIIEGQIEELSA